MATRLRKDNETGLETITPTTHPGNDAIHFRAIIAAKGEVERAEERLVDAVAAARAAGDSWTMVGAALGISKQAAHQRFGGRDPRT